MELVNNTPFAVALYRSQISEEDLLRAVLVSSCRYTLDARGTIELAPATQQRPTPEPDGPEDPAYGVIPEPGIYPRTGVDVIVIGDAIAPRPGASHTRVRIVAGTYDLSFDVYGDRVWQRSARGLRPSAPAAFERIPLTYARAYGGKAASELGPFPFPANPEGRGYYLSEDEALGQPLPNLEDVDDPIRSWTDQPEPVGCGPYPMSWSLRSMRCINVDSDTQVVSVSPERGLFDAAHPRLSGQRFERGRVRIEGMTTPPALIDFELPACPVITDIRIGERGGPRELQLDEIVVDVLRGLVDLSWQKSFTYRFRPHQTRRVRVETR